MLTYMFSILGRNLLRGESPQSIGESPKQTPQPSPPPAVTTNIHQVFMHLLFIICYILYVSL